MGDVGGVIESQSVRLCTCASTGRSVGRREWAGECAHALGRGDDIFIGATVIYDDRWGVISDGAVGWAGHLGLPNRRGCALTTPVDVECGRPGDVTAPGDGARE
nr:hypothetical protein [Providencia rettgeri]